MYLLREFEENPADLWKTDIFGKSLHKLFNERTSREAWRVCLMMQETSSEETIERVINEGCSGLIYIIL